MPPDDRHPCAGCALTRVPRRDFLRDAAAQVLLSLAAMSATARQVAALPIAVTSGTGSRADKAYPLPAADGVAIDREESVIIARFDSRAYAFSLACPHQSTAIRWDGRNGRFQCPKHKSRYRTDGTFIEGRATRGLDRFAIRRDGERLLVNLDALYREDRDAAQWAAAFIQIEK